ncbi:glycosyl transferase [Sphingobium sp. LB126]|uniref:glycosyltransferase family 2 protein n=1 Tax=Sphingobium sp. LB126 TaxID=1983755 RepID=UPI000C20AC09|nr:glycosyltransferase family 2 protein [Sphingobium sp. LB126]PJG45960.1 glycosyl transferase [Sphingobium sp. LB126]
MTALLTIILPFFNEKGWIGTTIDSLAAQSDPRFRLLLIDNGSTDAGADEARTHAFPLEERATILPCPTPGKIHAMAHGLDHVTTPLVAICDADTRYPPDYVRRIIELFENHDDAAAVMAIDLYAPETNSQSRERIAFILRKSRRFAGKCHAGGYAQAFRADALRAAGGFDVKRWPYVLEDHEIVHRVMAHGRAVYHPSHVCFPSDRRASRTAVSWTRGERLLYRYTPRAAMNWYFYRFLGRRLAARNSMGIALRRKDWSFPNA